VPRSIRSTTATNSPRCSTNELARYRALRLGDYRVVYSHCFLPGSWPVLILPAPCIASQAVDQGQPAPCDGVLISTERARQAVADKREVNLRRTFECDPCPACPEPPPDRTKEVASASFFAGFVLGLLLLFVR